MASIGSAGAQGMLAEHNAKRAAHCVSPLTWSMQLEQLAKGHAQTLAQSCQGLAHNPNAGGDVGENLGFSGEKGSANGFSAQQAIDNWYAEMKNYDFSTGNARTPGAATGHFTQIVSARSTQVGCGASTCQSSDGWTKHFWVCNYAPHGNMSGQFTTNVKPVCK
ncbi:unnamed protein product [Phaeothamnion confervicola]